MSASRSILVFSLIFLAFLLPVWRPWSGLSPEVRGLSQGADTAVHRTLLLEAETSIVTFRPAENNLEKAWKDISERLHRRWGASLVSLDKKNQLIVFEVGSFVTSVQLNEVLGAGEVLEIRAGKSERLVDRAVEVLKRRLDPYGLSGDSIRKVGENSIVAEVAGEVDESLLTASGRLEIFVDEDLAATPADILGFGRLSKEGEVCLIPVYFTSDGRNNFNSVVKGRQYSYLLFFLDRPADGVVIFDPQDLADLKEFLYDNERGVFVDNASRAAVNIPAFPSQKDLMSDNLANYLAGHFGEKSRVVLLGGPSEFSENFLSRIPSSYRVEFVERENETPDGWLRRALGFLVSVPVSPSLAENGVRSDAGINLPLLVDVSAAANLRRALLDPLPVVVRVSASGTAEAERSPTPSGCFAICFAPVVVFSLALLPLYRSARLSAVFLVFNFCTLVVLFGLMSVLGVRITWASLAACLAISSASLTCFLQVIFEMLGGFRRSEGAHVGWRRSRALNPAYLWSLILLLVLITVSLSGFVPLLPLSISGAFWIVIFAVFGLPAFASMVERAAVSKKKEEA